MLKSAPAIGQLILCCASTVPLSCGAPSAAKTPTAAAAAAPATVPVAAPAPERRATPSPEPQAAPAHEAADNAARDSAGFSEALALLRPVGTEPALQALAQSPTNAEAYATAALAFAPTEVPGMTLLWGLSYQAMGGGRSDAAVANAFAKVLSERISAKLDEETNQVSFNLRLAPGQMPVRQAADGSVEAPIAHAFEALFGPAVIGFRPPWTIEQFYDALSTWVGVVALHGSALDAQAELDGWLVTLAKAGHLEAFCYQLLGPAFPSELKAYKAAHAPALSAYRKLVKVAPLRPAHVALPDDLVRIK